MTYLDLVNAVLTRLREDSVTTVAGSDDVVVQLVKDFVNDAKEIIENAHTWSGLSSEWTFDTSTSSDKVVLTGSSRSVILDEIFDANGNELRQIPKAELRSRALRTSGEKNTPQYYCVDGKESNGDVRLHLWPAPKAVETFTVYGYQNTADLSMDTDILFVPSRPVIYMAQGMAARERGEVGAQSPQELMQLAQSYLSNEIAKDATNSDTDNIWTSV